MAENRLLFAETERVEDAFKEEWTDLLVANVALIRSFREAKKEPKALGFCSPVSRVRIIFPYFLLIQTDAAL